jgi:serine/threonine protein kinase
VAESESEAQTGAATVAPGRPEPDAPEGASLAGRPLVPERIARYVVLRRLGAGAMGVVVIAYDPELDRQVAIKLIHPRVAKRPDARSRMLREAKGLARLSHPNVVQIYDAGTVDGRVFIAMELVDGEPLSSWRGAGERSLEQILAVYTQAGEGLAAAHDAGLVHRDFKPDNVLVDREGRARVLDFGLVRASDDADTRERSGPHASAADLIGTEPTLEVSLAQTKESGGLMGLLSSSELELELTHGGQIMGTPAYMSPEQWKGGKADARSDQFSFCVALWEALYGERPFRARTVHALARAITSGSFSEPESAVRLPRRVRAALERGLLADPSRRFESMHALLRELRREDWSRRSLPLAGLALAGFAVLAWVRFVGMAAPEPPSCADAGAKVDEIWSEARRETITASFAATEVPSEQILARIGADLDDYAGRWRAAATSNCAATYLRKTQSQELLDLRTRCLDAKLRELDALLEVLGQADAATVDQAVLAVESLPSLRACEADRVSRLEAALPDDAALAERVGEARRALARVRASLDTGRFTEADERIEPLGATVEAIDYPPLDAEFALERGRLLARIDRREEAAAELQRSYFQATSLRDDELALRAATWLAELEGAQRQRPEFAQLWAEQAHALLARDPGRFPDLAADLADTLSWNAYLRDDLDAARAEAERGLALLEAARLDAPMRRMALLLDRGAAEYRAGDLAAAEASFGAALELAEATVGRDNAKATGALNNLAITYSAQGEHERARVLLEESVATRERALGPDNATVGVGLSNLADIELELGRPTQALAAAKRADAILRAAVGPNQYASLIARQRLGLARARVGAHDDAIIDLRDALAIAEAPPQPDPSLALELRAELATVLAAAGRSDESTAELDAVIAADPSSWRELVAAGRFAAALGERSTADALLGLALERAEHPEDAGGRRTRALAKLALAELWIEEDPRRAAALLGPELDDDLRSAPKLAAALAELRERVPAGATK